MLVIIIIIIIIYVGRGFAGARPHVIHDTLLVTDGHSNCGEISIQQGARLLQGVSHVFALGVGLANDTEARWELNSVVSDSDPRHIFSLARFQDFKDMLESIGERQKTLPCLPIVDVTQSGPPPSPPSSTPSPPSPTPPGEHAAAGANASGAK